MIRDPSGHQGEYVLVEKDFTSFVMTSVRILNEIGYTYSLGEIHEKSRTQRLWFV